MAEGVLTDRQVPAHLELTRTGEVVTVIVNSYPATPASTVQDGDTVTLTKVIGGG